MIARLKQEFLMGFHEGWETFWSPFRALWHSILKTWRNHIGGTRNERTPRLIAKSGPNLPPRCPALPPIP